MCEPNRMVKALSRHHLLYPSCLVSSGAQCYLGLQYGLQPGLSYPHSQSGDVLCQFCVPTRDSGAQLASGTTWIHSCSLQAKWSHPKHDRWNSPPPPPPRVSDTISQGFEMEAKVEGSTVNTNNQQRYCSHQCCCNHLQFNVVTERDHRLYTRAQHHAAFICLPPVTNYITGVLQLFIEHINIYLHSF